MVSGPVDWGECLKLHDIKKHVYYYKSPVSEHARSWRKNIIVMGMILSSAIVTDCDMEDWN
jgi:hypothetical protein